MEHKPNHLPYRHDLVPRARQMRKEMPPAEHTLWQRALRSRQLGGHKFTRQKPLGSFIVDFYCADLRLAVEIDGDSHAERAVEDAERTAKLGELGVRVIRVANSDVLGNMEGVYAFLLQCAQEREGEI
jgi:very-short-patch-repair endonuclease